MIFVYLDEFGHIGPYAGRSGRKHNESPVFGLAGFMLPEQAVRSFATFFLQLKTETFRHDLDANGAMPAKWEKKGTSFIRPKPMTDYPNLRKAMFRIITRVSKEHGRIFYYGREKERGKLDGNSIGLYTTCLAHALRRIDAYCQARGESFVVVLDQHSARKELIECAAKTMFGANPCRRLASPPFEVESYLNQNIQAADWIATLIGRLGAFDSARDEFPEYSCFHDWMRTRLDNTTAPGSEIMRRAQPRKKKRPVAGDGPFASLARLLEAPK